MTDHANELRRHVRKLGSPAGDTPSVMTAAAAHIDRMEETLRTVERWANHHARKPSTTASEALGVIQHHPVIRAITAGYADGVIPSTPDPYEEIERLRAALETVVAWGPFPESGHHWEDGHGNTRPMSYSAAHGSAGERDYMRAIARRALSAKGEKQ